MKCGKGAAGVILLAPFFVLFYRKCLHGTKRKGGIAYDGHNQ